MKNILNVLPIIYMLYSCIFSYNDPSGIKSLVQYEFIIEDTVSTSSDDENILSRYVLSDTLHTYMQNFNENGQLIEELIYNTRNHELLNKKTYQYHPNGSISEHEEYDDHFGLVVHREYRDDKKITYYYYWGRTTNYTYNNLGNITDIEFNYSYGDSVDNQNCVFEYDEYNNITHFFFYSNNNLVREYVFNNSYDSKGRLSEITYYLYIYDGNYTYLTQCKRIYEYNLTGYKVYHYYYYQDVIAEYYVLVYNKGILIDKKQFNSNDDLLFSNNIEYDDDYKLLEYAQIDSNGQIYSGVEFTYNKKNLIGITEYSEYTGYNYLEATYDDKNNLLEYIKHNDHSIWNADYSYSDSYPNRLDPFFFHNFLIYIYELYYYNLSDIEHIFLQGHYSYYNYDKNGIWEIMIEHRLSNGNPIKLYIQGFELY